MRTEENNDLGKPRYPFYAPKTTHIRIQLADFLFRRQRQRPTMKTLQPSIGCCRQTCMHKEDLMKAYFAECALSAFPQK